MILNMGLAMKRIVLMIDCPSFENLYENLYENL
jgi:hypothetical protein